MLWSVRDLCFESTYMPHWCSSFLLPISKLYLLWEKKKKSLFYNCGQSVSVLSYEGFVLYSIEANVNEAHGPGHPGLLSPEPDGIQTAYFYTY